MLEEVALEVTISSTAVELASRAVQSDALIVCSIVIRCSMSNVAISIFCQIPTTSFERSLQVFTEVDLSTGEEVIQYETIISNGVQRHLAELDLEVLVVALCPNAFYRQI